MSRTRFLFVLTAALTTLACSSVSEKGTPVDRNRGLPESSLGLAKVDVRMPATPLVTTSTALEPGDNARAGTGPAGTPPIIPHTIVEFVPLRGDENACIDCHDLPDSIGAPLEQGNPTPMPASHYRDLRQGSAQPAKHPVGARFNCTQCHVPQANTPPLVENSAGTTP